MDKRRFVIRSEVYLISVADHCRALACFHQNNWWQMEQLHDEIISPLYSTVIRKYTLFSLQVLEIWKMHWVGIEAISLSCLMLCRFFLLLFYAFVGINFRKKLFYVCCMLYVIIKSSTLTLLYLILGCDYIFSISELVKLKQEQWIQNIVCSGEDKLWKDEPNRNVITFIILNLSL